MAVKKAEKSKTKHLVIVESPTKAGTINKFLGKDYHVEASFGHVRDLPKSKMGVDVANDFVPQYIIPSKAKKTVNKLKKAAEGMQTIFLAALLMILCYKKGEEPKWQWGFKKDKK